MNRKMGRRMEERMDKGKMNRRLSDRLMEGWIRICMDIWGKCVKDECMERWRDRWVFLKKILPCRGSSRLHSSTSLLHQEPVGLPEPRCREGCLMRVACCFEMIQLPSWGSGVGNRISSARWCRHSKFRT